MKSNLGLWMRWINLTLVTLTLLCYLSPFVDPAGFSLFALLGLFYPWLLLANILFILFWSAARHRYLIFSLGAILVGFQHCQRFVGFHSQDTDSSPALKVMTYNCRQLVPMKNSVKKWEPRELAELVSRYRPDVLCIQEFSLTPYSYQPALDLLAEKAGLKYNYSSPREGLAILSRFPMGDAKSTHYYQGQGKNNGYQYVDIKTDQGTVRMFNIHLQTNAVSRIADHVVEEGHLKEKTWLEIKGMLGRYKRSTAIRAAQAKEIAELVHKSPLPVITCGDFNDVPQSYAYRRLAKGRKDSFLSRGKGLAITFKGSIPALRIDYILADPVFRILSHKTIHEGYSDHYPVMSRLQLDK